MSATLFSLNKKSVSPSKKSDKDDDIVAVFKNRTSYGQNSFNSINNSGDLLESMIRKNRVLLRIHAIFPFDLFPDEIVIDENKVSVYSRSFFFNDDIRCFCYKDIQFVEIFTSVLFATLQIKVFGFPNDVVTIGYLKKSDAFKARRLIHGLMEGSRANLSFSELDKEKIVTQAELLGSAHGRDDWKKIN